MRKYEPTGPAVRTRGGLKIKTGKQKSGIKLIVSDFDGTLKHSGDYVSDKNTAALREFTDRGGYFSIATARPLHGLLPYIRNITFMDYIILCNGAYIWSVHEKKMLEPHPLPVPVSRFLVEHYWDKPGFFLIFLGAEKTYINKTCPNKDIAGYMKVIKSRIITRSKLLSLLPLLYDIEIAADHILLSCLKRELHARFGRKVSAQFSWPNFMEIYSGSASKGKALKSVRLKLGISKQNVAAFGDGNNDLELFREAGTAIAMDNATDKLKKRSHHITEHYNDDGVAKFIRTYIL